jgi:hypothetical protein
VDEVNTAGGKCVGTLERSTIITSNLVALSSKFEDDHKRVGMAINDLNRGYGDE